jgi:hypothetical protein
MQSPAWMLEQVFAACSGRTRHEVILACGGTMGGLTAEQVGAALSELHTAGRVSYHGGNWFQLGAQSPAQSPAPEVPTAAQSPAPEAPAAAQSPAPEAPAAANQASAPIAPAGESLAVACRSLAAVAAPASGAGDSNGQARAGLARRRRGQSQATAARARKPAEAPGRGQPTGATRAILRWLLDNPNSLVAEIRAGTALHNISTLIHEALNRHPGLTRQESAAGWRYSYDPPSETAAADRPDPVTYRLPPPDAPAEVSSAELAARAWEASAPCQGAATIAYRIADACMSPAGRERLLELRFELSDAKRRLDQEAESIGFILLGVNLALESLEVSS